MISFTTVESNLAYVTRESAQTVSPASRRGFHNPEFNHQVMVFLDGSVVLMSIPTCISLHKVGEAPTDLGTVSIGEVVLVDGKEYTVTSRQGNNPLLVPVA